MLKILFIFIINIFSIYSIVSNLQQYPKSDECVKDSNHFVIEGLVDYFGVTDSPSETQQFIAGLLSWREETNNNNGGVCKNKICSEKLIICVNIVYPPASISTEPLFLEYLKEYYSELLNRDIDKLPDTIVSSAGVIYSEAVIEELKEISIPIPFFVNTLAPIPYTESTIEAFFIGSTYNYYSDTFANSLSNRYKLKSVVIAAVGEENSYEYTHALDISVKLEMRHITVLGKRCKNTVTLSDGVECVTEYDCGIQEQCQIPRFNHAFETSLEREMYIYNWVLKFKEYNPDGFILFSDDKYFLSFSDSMRLSEWAPKFVASPSISSLTSKPEYDIYPSFWHAEILFDLSTNKGETDKYMGTTSEWKKKIDNKYKEKYLNPGTNTYGYNIINNDYFYIGLGSAVGVTIEYALSRCDYITDNRLDGYKNFANSIKKIGTCQDESTPCSLDSECRQRCIPFNTFFGNILIDDKKINSKMECIIAQFQPNLTDLEIKYIYPLTIPDCNLDGEICVETNIDECSCKSIYPAEWSWQLRVKDDIYKFNSGSGIGLLITQIILLIVIALFMIYVIVKKKGPFIIKEYGNFYTVFYISLLISLLSTFFLFEKHSSFNCVTYLLLDVVSSQLGLLSLFITSIILIKISDNEAIDYSELWRNTISVIVLLTSLIILWLLSQPPTVVTNKLYENNMIYQYSYCKLSDFTISFYISLYVLILFVIIFEIKLYYIERTYEKYILIIQIALLSIKCLVVSITLIASNDESEKIVDSLLFIYNDIYVVIVLVSTVFDNFIINPKCTSKVSSDTREINRKDLEKFSKLLMDHIYRVHFDMFLREFNLNNYTDFFSEVEQYRQKDDNSANEIAHKIFSKYITSEAKYKIELNEQIIIRIKNGIDGQSKPDSNIFDSAQYEALQYLQVHGYMDQFKHSKYIQMIDKSNKIIKYFQTLSQPVLHGVVESMKKSLEEAENKEAEKEGTDEIGNDKSVLGTHQSFLVSHTQLSQKNISSPQTGSGSKSYHSEKDSNASKTTNPSNSDEK